jgi:hypothetical protein
MELLRPPAEESEELDAGGMLVLGSAALGAPAGGVAAAAGSGADSDEAVAVAVASVSISYRLAPTSTVSSLPRLHGQKKSFYGQRSSY